MNWTKSRSTYIYIYIYVLPWRTERTFCMHIQYTWSTKQRHGLKVSHNEYPVQLIAQLLFSWTSLLLKPLHHTNESSYINMLYECNKCYTGYCGFTYYGMVKEISTSERSEWSMLKWCHLIIIDMLCNQYNLIDMLCNHMRTRFLFVT